MKIKLIRRLIISTVLVIAISCSNMLSDVIGPTLPKDSRIIQTELNGTSMTITWNQSTDDTPESEGISYRIYYSLNNNIGSVNEALKNGIPVNNWINNKNTMIVPNLAPETTYYFTIIAKDPAGNKTFYGVTTLSSGPDTVNPIPGAEGLVKFDSLTETSVSLYWEKAKDNWTDQQEIEYNVYYSDIPDVPVSLLEEKQSK